MIAEPAAVPTEDRAGRDGQHTGRDAKQQRFPVADQIQEDPRERQNRNCQNHADGPVRDQLLRDCRAAPLRELWTRPDQPQQECKPGPPRQTLAGEPREVPMKAEVPAARLQSNGLVEDALCLLQSAALDQEAAEKHKQVGVVWRFA